MNPRPILFKLTSRRRAFVVAFVFAIAASVNSTFAGNSTPGPKIGRVEIGVKSFFKVGFWTPVRVEIDGVAEAGTQRIEVTVADSDGVPTTASAPLKVASISGDPP